MTRMLTVTFFFILLVSVGRGDDAFPASLTEFTPCAENPVFTGAGPGHWDERIRERGWILHENGLYRMWYTGYRDALGSVRHLGYATSLDGIHWSRRKENPLDPELWIEDVMVVRDGETLYMFAEGRFDQAHLLVSVDGIHWTGAGRLDVRLANGDPIPPGPYGTPTAWKEGETWYLFYERRDLGIWLATSKDMEVWTNVSDEPVIRPGPEPYDARAVAMNQIVKVDGKYYASYHGHAKEGKAEWCSCLAVSDDLRTWRKYAKNPLFPAKLNRSSAVYVPVDHEFWLYTMHDRVELFLPVKE